MQINCKGTLVDLSTPKIMGILNVTPDSFYDGGKHTKQSDILFQVEKMLEQGASFIDIGGYSSKPGAQQVSVSEELKRTIATIALVHEKFPEALLSIDTFRAAVAKQAVAAGAVLVNDISAGTLDPELIPVVATLKVPYCMMHMQGTPQTMQKNPTYTDVVTDILHFFSKKLAQTKALQIKDVLLDPGFGFGKTLEDNYTILKNLSVFKNIGHPLLIGMSRKSMIYKPLQSDAKNALNGTSCLNTVALLQGASILRVHDVKQAKECITLTQLLK